MPHLPPDDWSAWLAHARFLTESGDPRGRIVEAEHARLHAAATPEAAEALRESVDTDLYLWLLDASVDATEREALWRYRELRSSLGTVAAVLPADLAGVMAYSLAQLVAGSGEQAPTACDRLEAAAAGVLSWIRRAFDGVPPPAPPSRTLRQGEALSSYDEVPRLPGEATEPWHAITESYLLENQWGLPYLDGDGLRYILPAVMSFAVRHAWREHPQDRHLTESLSVTLMPSPLVAVDRGRHRMADLTADQRAAIAGFCWLTEDDSCAVWVAAAQGGPDWITAFIESA